MTRDQQEDYENTDHFSIEFPVLDNHLELVMSEDFESDNCLTFYSNGRIESNGGHVSFDEIDNEETLSLLPDPDRARVRKFLDGDYSAS